MRERSPNPDKTQRCVGGTAQPFAADAFQLKRLLQRRPQRQVVFYDQDVHVESIKLKLKPGAGLWNAILHPWQLTATSNAKVALTQLGLAHEVSRKVVRSI